VVFGGARVRLRSGRTAAPVVRRASEDGGGGGGGSGGEARDVVGDLDRVLGGGATDKSQGEAFVELEVVPQKEVEVPQKDAEEKGKKARGLYDADDLTGGKYGYGEVRPVTCCLPHHPTTRVQHFLS